MIFFSFVFYFCHIKMLAKEIMEDNLLPFMSQEIPSGKTDREQLSKQVLSCVPYTNYLSLLSFPFSK